MDEIEALAGVDLKSWVLTLFVILFGIAAALGVIEKISVAVGKPVKWIKGRSKDHDAIKETAQDLAEFKTDMKKYGAFYREMNDDIAKLKTEMDKSGEYYEEMAHQLDEFMAGIKESVNELKESNHREDKQIDALAKGVTVILGKELDKDYMEFVSLGGVPMDKLPEYQETFNAYSALGGNGRRKAEHDYIDRLKAVPPAEGKEAGL